MSKLNNRGFAISTMLYGILTMIVLILMLLLNIMRSSYNREKVAKEDISYYLDRCISRQVLLENCYRDYDISEGNRHSCADEYDAYVACMDSASVSRVSGTGVELRNLVIDGADEQSGLVIDTTETTGVRYVFTGSSPLNYVRIGNKTGRIIALETDGTIKVILNDTISSVFDDGQKAGNNPTRWQQSKLYATLKSRYNALGYTSKIANAYFYVGTFNNSNTAQEAIENALKVKYQDFFGLPSVEDIIKASSNLVPNTCRLSENVKEAFNDCRSNNWLANIGNGSCYWTSSPYSDVNTYLTFSSSVINGQDVTRTCGANMVIFLASGTTVSPNGNGTQGNPYAVIL